MIISNLLTRYILAPIWARLLIFIIFYFIIREFHFMDSCFLITECMVTDDDTNEIVRNSAEILHTTSSLSSGDNTLEILLLENQIDIARGQNETLRLQNEQLQNEVINLRNVISIQQQEINNLANVNTNISENYRELYRASRELHTENQTLNAQIVTLNQQILDLLQR